LGYASDSLLLFLTLADRAFLMMMVELYFVLSRRHTLCVLSNPALRGPQRGRFAVVYILHSIRLRGICARFDAAACDIHIHLPQNATTRSWAALFFATWCPTRGLYMYVACNIKHTHRVLTSLLFFYIAVPINIIRELMLGCGVV
jgi:hypothetical protein